jgi:hypothetical protein
MVMLFKGSSSAFSNACSVLAFIFLKYAFIFDHINSIGLQSGLYGGKYRTVAPVAIMGAVTPSTLCELKLSITTISPDFNVGARH